MGKAGKHLREPDHRRAKAPQEGNPDLTRENARLRAELEKAKQNGRQLDETNRFEKLLLEISTRLVHLPAGQVGQEIERGLRRVGELLGLDRGNLYQLSEDRRQLHLLHTWTAEGIPQSPLTIGEGEYPWLGRKLQNGQTILVERIEDLPEEAARDKESLRKGGNKSILMIPLAVGKDVLGVVTLGSLREEQSWPESLVQRVLLVGEIFAHALARKRAEEALRQTELDYRTVADFTYDWAYWANPDGTLRYISPSCQRITGYTPRSSSTGRISSGRSSCPSTGRSGTNTSTKSGGKCVLLKSPFGSSRGRERFAGSSMPANR
jgi:PAS domain-containing protein